MRSISIVFFIFLTALMSFGQTSLKNGPKVNGIALGATKDEVIRRFGKPLSEVRKEAEPCVGGTEMTLRYPGIKIILWDDPADESKFTVGMIEVTTAAWVVSGAKVGQSSVFVRGRFGKPNAQETDPTTKRPVWYYEMNEENPGNTHFTFRNGRIVKITALYLMC